MKAYLTVCKIYMKSKTCPEDATLVAKRVGAKTKYKRKYKIKSRIQRRNIQNITAYI